MDALILSYFVKKKALGHGGFNHKRQNTIVAGIYNLLTKFNIYSESTIHLIH